MLELDTRFSDLSWWLDDEVEDSHGAWSVHCNFLPDADDDLREEVDGTDGRDPFFFLPDLPD